MDPLDRSVRPPAWRARLAHADPYALAQTACLVLVVTFAVGGVVRGGHRGQVAWLDVGVFNGVFLLAVVLCVRPADRDVRMLPAWRLVALALSLSLAGNVCLSVALAGGPGAVDPPGAAVADVLYLAAYPAAGLAVVLTVRARVPRFLASLWWDAAVTGLGVAAVLLCLPAAQRLAVRGPDDGWAALVYPVADLVQVALLVAGVVMLQGHASRELVTAGLGLATIAAGDVLYLLQQAAGSYAEGGPSDTVELAGVALLGVAAGMPGRGRAPEPRAPDGAAAEARVPDVLWPVLVLPSAAAAGSVLLLAVPGWGGPVPRVLATACVVAALVRMFLTLREIRGLGEIHRQARTDDLTGLPNRRAFAEHCDLVVRQAGRDGLVALILLDLDRFKQVNDSLGHVAGDELLVQVAARLRRALPAGAVASRLAGDEFAVVVPGADEERGLALAGELERALGRVFVIDGLAVHIAASMGVACAGAGTTRRELLRCADVALYRAKLEGEGPLPYSAVSSAGSQERLRTAEELRGVLDGGAGAGQLVVHLQPQVGLPGGHVVGMEALVRWEHPTLGLLPPAAFLGAGRAAGLMAAITARVLDLALTACRSCWDAGHQLPVSVNMSAAGLHDTGLPAKVTAALRRHGLPPRALVVELTEDTLMTRPDRARGVLEQLRAVGVGVSVDDYGTGYSSLAYLRHLPVDELKLDRVFIADLPTDAAAGAIVRHTVELAHSLGIRLVAEGIEDRATMELVARLGGDVAQGYHVARPMPIEQLLRWLAAHESTRAGVMIGET